MQREGESIELGMQDSCKVRKLYKFNSKKRIFSYSTYSQEQFLNLNKINSKTV